MHQIKPPKRITCKLSPARVQGVQESLQQGHAETRKPRERNPQDRANRPAGKPKPTKTEKTREPKERNHRTGDRQTEPEGADQDKLE